MGRRVPSPLSSKNPTGEPMKASKHLRHGALLAVAGFLAMPPQAKAAVHVFACLPEWGAVAREIAGPDSSVYVVASPLENPDNVQLRPSIVTELQKADIAF